MILGASWLDWKLGGRILVKYPGLAVIGGLTLAVAIGLGAGWFEVTRQLLKPRLPLPEGDRIVRIDVWDAAESEIETRSLYDLQLSRDQLTSIQALGAYRAFERNLITPDGAAHPTPVAEISASAFPLTRVQPWLGRTLIAADAEPGAADVVVIGYDVRQSRFNGEPDVIGCTVRLGRTRVTIVGVMPEAFGFPRVSSYGAPPPGSDDATMLRLSNIIAWLILAAACANVATLLFARTATREAEIVVRSALGASRARVMMQLFVEAFVLCAVAAVVGLTAASFALDHAVHLFMQSEQNARLPFWWQFGIGPATVLYAAVLALCGAVLVALLPAIKATGPRVQTALTLAASGSTRMRFGGVWSAMIVLQVVSAALCLPLGVFAVVGRCTTTRCVLTFPRTRT